MEADAAVQVNLLAAPNLAYQRNQIQVASST